MSTMAQNLFGSKQAGDWVADRYEPVHTVCFDEEMITSGCAPQKNV